MPARFRWNSGAARAVSTWPASRPSSNTKDTYSDKSRLSSARSAMRADRFRVGSPSREFRDSHAKLSSVWRRSGHQPWVRLGGCLAVRLRRWPWFRRISIACAPSSRSDTLAEWPGVIFGLDCCAARIGRTSLSRILRPLGSEHSWISCSAGTAKSTWRR